MRPDGDIAAALGIRAGLRTWIGGRHRQARAALEPLLVDGLRPPDGAIDLLIVCPTTLDEARYFIAKHLPRLTEDGVLWVLADLPRCDEGADDVLGNALCEEGLVEGGGVEVAAGHLARKFTRRPAHP